MEEHRLLSTTTREPYQPVRLTYTVPGRGFAVQRLRRLRCVEEDRKARTLEIWLDDEARELALDEPEPHVEAFGQRVLLATIRFPKGRMALQVRSIRRAIEIAKLLGPVLGTRVQLVRARIVNRWFAAEELTGELDELDGCLDRDVTVIRWEDAERDFEQMLEGATTQEEKLRAFEGYKAERRRRDVPMVEDFPLHPEDENEEMTDLRSALNFRFVRAGRRWRGEEVTLVQVIEETVAEIEPKLR